MTLGYPGRALGGTPERTLGRLLGNVHEWLLAVARSLSSNVGRSGGLMFILAANALSIAVKYADIAPHHVLILQIVDESQGTVSNSPDIIFSIVSAQCRLYGTRTSGNS
jgi:hypothetical protein